MREDEVVGWAALRPHQERPGDGAAAVLVYVAPGHQGQGIGASLLGALLELGNAAGISRFYASVFTGNAPSVRLHRRFGFAPVRIEPRPEDFEGDWLETRLLVRETGTGRAP